MKDIEHNLGKEKSDKLLAKSIVVISALALLKATTPHNLMDFEVDKKVDTVKSPTLETIPFPQNHIYYDADKLPMGYILSDGTQGVFRKEDVLELQSKAIEEGEPQILTMLPYPDKINNRIKSNDSFSQAHAEVFELPDDVLTEDELLEKGLKIIQGESAQLFIRSGAFEKGAVFGNLTDPKWVSGFDPALTIVLVDGPVLSSEYMRDPKYDKYRELIESSVNGKSVSQFREEKIQKTRKILESLRLKQKDLKDNNSYSDERKKRFEGIMLYLNMELYAFQKVLTDDQILELAILSPGSVEAGKYFLGEQSLRGVFTSDKKGNIISSSGQGYHDRTILLPIGKSIGGFSKQVFYFDSKGVLNIRNQEVVSQELVNFAPQSNQSYPNPADFPPINRNASFENPESYPYGALFPGWNVRHEVEHDAMIAQRLNNGELPDVSEYNTDINTVHRITQAWEKYINTEYQDDDDYYFVIRLPNGSLIITKDLKTSAIQS